MLSSIIVLKIIRNAAHFNYSPYQVFKQNFLISKLIDFLCVDKMYEMPLEEVSTSRFCHQEQEPVFIQRTRKQFLDGINDFIIVQYVPLHFMVKTILVTYISVTYISVTYISKQVIYMLKS